MQRISGPPLSNILLIEPQSSLDFVRTAFRLYENHELFAFSKPGTAADFPSEINVRRGAPMLDKRGWFEEPHEPIIGPDPAQITYTSGTTGSSKGIILSHDNLADTVRRLVDFQKLDSTVAEYVGVPAHYSFGLARFRACAAVGGRAYIPARGFDPLELGRMLRDGEINSLAAVPSLLRLLLGQPTVIGNAGRVLRWLEIGSQPMTRAEKERLKTIFPEAHITQHYGLTEASRTTLLDVSAAKAHVLDSVGKPVGETEIGLSSDGRIMVRGPHVARHWINRSGVHPLVDSDGWLTTGDNGLIDPDGHLYFRGRADDVINFGGIKLAPELIEDGVRARQTHPIRLAVARIPHRERGEGILLATDGPNADLDALRSTALEVLSGLGVAAGAGLEVRRMELPTTDTGKVRRNALADSFAALHAVALENDPLQAALPTGDSLVLDAFRAAFPTRQVKASDTFIGLGGDSLAHVSINVHLDSLGGLPEGWEEKPISQLQAFARPDETKPAGHSFLRAVTPELAVRSAAVVMIVAHHAAYQFEIGGGVDVLLLLVGVNLARFQTDRLLSPFRWRLLVDLFVRLVLPYYAILFVLLLLYPQIGGYSDFALISNFSVRTNILQEYWFVCAYFQSILILIAACYLAPVRTLLRTSPGMFGAVLLGLALTVKVVAMAIFHHVWLLGRTPDQFFYIIALGWCTQKARSPVARGLILGLTALIALLSVGGVWSLWNGFEGRWHGFALLGAILVLFYVKTLKVPVFLRHAIAEVALSSLVIYLVHWLVLSQVRGGHSIGRFVEALLVSLAVARALRFASRHMRFFSKLAPSQLSVFGQSH